MSLTLADCLEVSDSVTAIRIGYCHHYRNVHVKSNIDLVLAEQYFNLCATIYFTDS